ncbi:MAG: 50S ribosomal protein L4 [Rudaea sp.]
MELQVAGAKKPLSVSDTIFGREYSEGLVHQVVVAYRNAGRAGTKAQKSRSDMSGTTKKFKAQKGGGARHGDYRAPIFVGGGRAFAARPRDFSQKVNKKMYRGAIQAILSQLNREGRLQIVDSFGVDKVSTKALATRLKDHSGRTLIVTENVEQNLFLSARNLHRVAVVDVAAMDPVTLVDAKKVVMTVDSVKKIEEWLA